MELQDYEREHAQTVRRLGAECTVLLKRNGDFPLEKPGDIALFGSGARLTVKGGTGSGEVNSRYFVTVEEGLENAGFTVTSKYWLETYALLRGAARERYLRQLRAEARKKHKIAALEFMGAVMPEPEYNIPLYGEGDTAVYVLSRISGEGSDRAPVPGDILLTETEIRDILCLQKKYKRFLLVLNVGGVVDLSPVMAVENILLLSQLGAETGNILADLLLGRAYPSGKLATTWAAWEDYPSIGEFGGRDETVSLYCTRPMAGVVIDRFGQDIIMVPKEDGAFTTHVLVSVSPQFYGWIAGLGGQVRILGPDSVRDGFRDYLDRLREQY